MIRKIRVIYTASDDPDFGPIEEEAVLIAPDMIIEFNDDLGFLIIPPVAGDQEIVEIDRAKCSHFGLSLTHNSKEREFEIEFLAEATFLDFIRKYASK